jgi:lipid-A-disaccharide synthase
MKFYFVAGERSGDLHGSNLIKALNNRASGLQFRGFGGAYMKGVGMDLVVDYHEMAFMGFLEVILNLRKISKKLDECKKDILAYQPDVIVLIDYAGFNLRIAKFAKQHGFKVFWYISPKVWAWNQSRAWKLKKNIDRMFVILPFEKDFFKEYDWEVDYVGNPVLDAVKNHNKANDFLQRHQLEINQPIIALLPGSRKQELQRIIPVMAEAVRIMPGYQFVVAAVQNLNEALYKPLVGLTNVKFVYDETYDLLSHAQAAVVTSGTATLETAIWRVPQVVVYKAGTLSYAIARSVIKVEFISLVNLIAGREIVRELIQYDTKPSIIVEELHAIMNGPKRDNVLKGYDKIIETLDTGSASENTAQLMLQYLSE